MARTETHPSRTSRRDLRRSSTSGWPPSALFRASSDGRQRRAAAEPPSAALRVVAYADRVHAPPLVRGSVVVRSVSLVDRPVAVRPRDRAPARVASSGSRPGTCSTRESPSTRRCRSAPRTSSSRSSSSSWRGRSAPASARARSQTRSSSGCSSTASSRSTRSTALSDAPLAVRIVLMLAGVLMIGIGIGLLHRGRDGSRAARLADARRRPPGRRPDRRLAGRDRGAR